MLPDWTGLIWGRRDRRGFWDSLAPPPPPRQWSKEETRRDSWANPHARRTPANTESHSETKALICGRATRWAGWVEASRENVRREQSAARDIWCTDKHKTRHLIPGLTWTDTLGATLTIQSKHSLHSWLYFSSDGDMHVHANEKQRWPGSVTAKPALMTSGAPSSVPVSAKSFPNIRICHIEIKMINSIHLIILIFYPVCEI